MTNYLTLNGVDLDKSFQPRDLRPLLGAQFRGENATLPTAAGTRGEAPIGDQLDVAIAWFCDGLFDPDGEPYVDVEYGLSANLAYYRDLFTTPDNEERGTSPAVLHLPDRDLLTDLQCWGWDELCDPDTGATSGVVMTRIIIPSGTWTIDEGS